MIKLHVAILLLTLVRNAYFEEKKVEINLGEGLKLYSDAVKECQKELELTQPTTKDKEEWKKYTEKSVEKSKDTENIDTEKISKSLSDLLNKNAGDHYTQCMGSAEYKKVVSDGQGGKCIEPMMNYLCMDNFIAKPICSHRKRLAEAPGLIDAIKECIKSTGMTAEIPKRTSKTFKEDLEKFSKESTEKCLNLCIHNKTGMVDSDGKTPKKEEFKKLLVKGFATNVEEVFDSCFSENFYEKNMKDSSSCKEVNEAIFCYNVVIAKGIQICTITTTGALMGSVK